MSAVIYFQVYTLTRACPVTDKVRKRQKTGQGLTAEVVLDELDEVILDIIGELDGRGGCRRNIC